LTSILVLSVGDVTKKSAGGAGNASRRPRPNRWIAAGLAVLVIVVAVFAVSQGGGGGGGPLDAIAKAAVVTQREPGGRALLRADVTSATTPEGIAETGSMIFDDNGRARGTVTFRGDTNGKEGKVQTIVDGTTSYAASEQLESLPEGKKWMEVDYSAAAKGSGSPDPADAGPKEGLKTLEGVQGSEEVGKEEIRGVPTTHYRGTLPAAKEVFGVKVDVSDPHVDVWIDGQDRVRRMQVALSSEVNGVEASATDTEMTIDYVSFGRVPKIHLPNPDEVFDATKKIESEVQSVAEGQ
jgi:LppX_LprAFG lipoprotein